MNRLKKLRVQHGYKTQKELADVLFVNQTAISQWERGATTPSSSMLQRLSELYQVSIDYILGLTDQEEKPTPKDEPDIAQAKIALFGGDGEVTDEMWEEAVFAAELIKNRHKRKKG